VQEFSQASIDDDSFERESDEANRTSAHRSVDLVQMVVRYRWLLLAGLAVGLAMSEAFYLHFGPEYEAVAKVLVSRRVSVILEESQPGDFGERGEHIALIMSPLIVGAAVESHDLRNLPTLTGVSDLSEHILSRLKVKRSAGQDRSFLNVLDISFRCANQTDSETIAAAIIDAYGAYLDESRTKNTKRLWQLADEANQRLGKQVREKEQEYLKFRESAPLHWKNAPGSEDGALEVTNVHRERFLEVETDRRKNLIRRAEIEARLDALQEAIRRGESREALEEMVRLYVNLESKSSQNTALPTKDDESSLDAQLIPLLIEERKLDRDFGAAHPDLQSVRKSIETLLAFYRRKGIRIPKQAEGGERSARVDFVAVYERSLEQLLTELDHREHALAILFEKEAALAKQYSKYLLTDQALNEDVRRVKTVWQAVVEQMSKIDLNKESAGYELSVIAPVRGTLVVKRHLKFLAIGGLCGLAGVFGFTYLRLIRDTRIRSLEELKNAFDVPMLGAIPDLTAAARSRPSRAEYAGLAEPLCDFERSSSSDAEAYRSTRAALFAAARPRQAKVIQIASPCPGEGKSTFVANLARAVAHAGRKVLLIDADMRAPTLHELHGVSNRVGLSDVLSGEIELLNASQHVDAAGVSILPAGSARVSPADLLASEWLARSIETARSEFDYVFIDSPALLAVSDACVVAPHCDGLVIVARMAESTFESIHRAANLLEAQQVDVIGMVAVGTPDAPDSPIAAAHQFASGSSFKQTSSHPQEPAIPVQSDVEMPV